MDFNIEDYKLMFKKPERLVEPYSWIEHIPFAFFLIEVSKPKLIVELGVYSGNSYNAFCQAIKYLNFDGKIFGIDTWKGDKHAGFYDESIYKDLKRYQEHKYADFSSLLKMTFDEGLDYFSNNSIDLLHIDGLHTYEAVKHDLDSWLPKMSKHGIIIMHDTCVREKGFGVWKLWEEVSKKYMNIEFSHGHGLGVLFLGKSLNNRLASLPSDNGKVRYLKSLFKFLGEKLKLSVENRLLMNAMSDYKAIDSTNIKLNERIKILENEKDELHKKYEFLGNEKEKLDKKCESLKYEMNKINQKCKSLKSYQVKLENQVHHLNNLYKACKNSLSWRITFPLRFFSGALLKVIHLMWNRNIFWDTWLGLKLLGREGVGVFHKRLIWYLKGKRLVEDIPEDLPKIRIIKWPKQKQIILPVVKNPIVSIVIPVYNNWDHTYLCIKSIKENTLDEIYEVILADDKSTDKTLHAGRKIKNIKIVRSDNNLGFLENCNQAAKHTLGKYIMIINNDTFMMKGWLHNLIDLAEDDDNIAIVGSKILFPDGKLQEAGGIIWNDGSGWNYGRNQDPNRSEFNYKREVDYISGTAILVRKSFWKKVDGFDERFKPAYYEDTDLAFQARSLGYKVVYQPKSQIIHFEGLSHGTDINDGIKNFQVLNSAKFYDKWKNVLQKEHYVNGENAFLARNKEKRKGYILVIDHYVPHYDKDAGSRSTYQYLKLLNKMNYQITFIGDNFFPHEPYTSELQSMGIEVLYGSYYRDNLQHWFQENGKYFDFAFTHRMHIAPKYFDLIRAYSKAKIIYVGHDLNFERCRKLFKLKNDIKYKNESEKFLKIETEIFKSVDIIYPFSTYEKEIIQEIVPDKIVRNIPVFFYEEIPESVKAYEERKDILFVGGFKHPPNLDGVIWFVKEVFPLVLKKMPDCKLHIVGSNPPNEILDLKSDFIEIAGYVSNQKLKDYYSSCRIAVIPLRYGAGVKGKLIEALYYQIPSVITSVAAEGVPEINDYSLMTDENLRFCEYIVKLYCDKEQWNKYSQNSKELIYRYFYESAVMKIFEKDFSSYKKAIK